MKVYRTDEIRNVVLLGHGGSGKAGNVIFGRAGAHFHENFMRML